MRARTIDGVEIHYEVTGSGPAVVLAHGVADSSADWDDIPDRLADDHTVVTFDLRGHGRSSLADDYSSLVVTQDMVSVIEASGIESPLLVGHALGAVVASVTATQVPCRGVVNIDQVLKFDPFVTTIHGLEEELRTGDFAAAMTAIFDSVDGGLSPEPIRSRFVGNRARFHRDVALGIWALVLRATPEEVNAMTGVVGQQIAVPYLALHGAEVEDGYPEWLAERIPTTLFEQWPGTGHYPHLVDPERFVTRLREFERAIELSPAT